MENNFINLTETELNNSIYRVFKLEHFLNLIKENKNALARPDAFEDDPYENLILRKVENKYNINNNQNKKHFDYNLRNCMYCQCWSFHEESDAIWRIYSPKNESIMIQSTIRNLIDSLENSKTIRNTSKGFCFIGKVTYDNEETLLKQSNLLSEAWDPEMGLVKGETLAKTLLLKRIPYSYENEVRLIFYDVCGPQHNYHPKIFKYELYLGDLIKRIVFDPRIDVLKAEMIYDYIVKYSGNNFKVSRSKLYDQPEV